MDQPQGYIDEFGQWQDGGAVGPGFSAGQTTAQAVTWLPWIAGAALLLFLLKR